MLSSFRVSLVAAEWTTIAWTICTAFFALMPTNAYQMMNTSYHMINTQSTLDPRLTLGGFFIGLVFWNIVVYLGVQLFVWLWNRTADRK